MPFYDWRDMQTRRLAASSDSEGSIIIGELLTLNRSVSRPGARARPHTHRCEQIIQVLEGHAWFRVGAEAKTVRAGDVIHIPPQTEHEFWNSGEGDFVYLSFKNKSGDWPPAAPSGEASESRPD